GRKTRFLVPFCRSHKKGLAGYAGETAAPVKHDTPSNTPIPHRIPPINQIFGAAEAKCPIMPRSFSPPIHRMTRPARSITRRPARMACLIAFAFALAQPALAETIRKPALDALITASKSTPPADFDAFLSAAAKADPAVAPAVAAYQARKPL